MDYLSFSPNLEQTQCMSSFVLTFPFYFWRSLEYMKQLRKFTDGPLFITFFRFSLWYDDLNGDLSDQTQAGVYQSLSVLEGNLNTLLMKWPSGWPSVSSWEYGHNLCFSVQLFNINLLFRIAMKVKITRLKLCFVFWLQSWFMQCWKIQCFWL